MALDLELRLATGGRRGLPEMFRRLWERLRPRRPADHRGRRARRRRARSPAAGWTLLRPLRARHRRAAAARRCWRRAGLERRGARRLGRERQAARRARSACAARRARAWTGIALHPERTMVRNVVPDSPAWRAGLTFNDEIVAVDGARVTPATFAKRVGDRRPGARVPHRLLPPRRAARGDADARREPRAPPVGRRRRRAPARARTRSAPAGSAGRRA